MRPRRHALAVELTSHCNQKCGYCYNPWREDNGRSVGSLPPDDLRTLVSRALDEVDFDHVTLTGGEPFARTDVFDLIGLCNDKGVGVHMISNGGMITDAIAERLATHRIGFIQVTLNGPSLELHEAHVGRGHWLNTLRGIRALVRHGVTVVGCVVVTRLNAGVVGEILDLFTSLGVRSVALSRFSPAGFAAANVATLLPSRTELLGALTQAEARGAAGMDLQVTMPVPQCVVDHDDFPHIHFGGCPVGTEMQEFALGPKGELRHCTLHAGELGNGHDTSFADLVEQPVVRAYRDVTPEFCQPCPFKASCIGGCGAAAASTLGDPRGLDPFVAQHVDDAFAARLQELRAAAPGAK